jgi:hypothetical protein
MCRPFAAYGPDAAGRTLTRVERSAESAKAQGAQSNCKDERASTCRERLITSDIAAERAFSPGMPDGAEPELLFRRRGWFPWQSRYRVLRVSNEVGTYGPASVILGSRALGPCTLRKDFPCPETSTNVTWRGLA